MALRYTSTVIAIVLTLFPCNASATGTIGANDSIAGLGIEVTLDGFPANDIAELLLVSPDKSQQPFSVRTDTKGYALMTIPGAEAEKAGIYTVSVMNGQAPAQSVTVSVEPESMDPWASTVQAWTPRIAADGRSGAEVTVTLRDRFGNVLSGRPVTLVSSRSEDTVTALTPETDTKGVQHFSVTTRQIGTMQLRAIDLLSGNTIVASADIQAGSAMGGEASFPYASPYAATVSGDSRFFYAQTLPSFDIIDHFVVEVPSKMDRGVEAQKVTIRAVDRDNNTVENYAGTIVFSSTDPEAVLPNFGTYTFKERDLGVKTFALALKFRTPGVQTFKVEDQNDTRITGEATVQVGGTSTTGESAIQITSHESDDYVSSLNIVIEGKGPRFVNLVVMGGMQDATGSTDETGFFSVPVTLNANQRDFTIRVRDESGRYDSGSLHLILDTDKPEISNIQFVPERPEAGEKLLIAIESEPKLGQVLLRLPAGNDVEEIRLIENPTQSGSYQAFFTAPDPGTYQPAIAAMDKAGNVTEVRTSFSVGFQQMPQVQNVKAVPRVEAVELSWDPVAGELDGYRIYIGSDPLNFLYTLDTERVITKAVVRGLLPGQTYYFAVTALKDALESEEKSDVISAQVLGLTLDVTPGNGLLNIKWTTLSNDLPLSSYVLAYGVEEGKPTESRTINGELRDYTIRDLLNGVTYFISLTPVTITGDSLDELASTGQGVPNGSGFKPSPLDPVPFDTVFHPGGTDNPPDSLSEEGIPPFAWYLAAALGALVVAYRIYRWRSVSKSDAFLRAVQAQYHHR